MLESTGFSCTIWPLVPRGAAPHVTRGAASSRAWPARGTSSRAGDCVPRALHLHSTLYSRTSLDDTIPCSSRGRMSGLQAHGATQTLGALARVGDLDALERKMRWESKSPNDPVREPAALHDAAASTSRRASRTLNTRCGGRLSRQHPACACVCISPTVESVL